MPIYLCQPGLSSKEPWRHGVQVYERPFPLPGDATTAGRTGRDAAPSAGGHGPVPKDVDQTVVTLGSEGEKFPTLLRYIDERTDLGRGGGGNGTPRNHNSGPSGKDSVLIHVSPAGSAALERRLEEAGHDRVGLAIANGESMTRHEVADVLGKYARREVRVLVLAGDDDGEGAAFYFYFLIFRMLKNL